MSIASIFLEGFAVTDGEISFTEKSGLDLYKVTIAVPGRHEGEETSFFNVRAWGKLARVGKALITKGIYVRIKGSLKQRRFVVEDPDGTKREVVTIGIVANSIDIPHEK